MFLEAFGIQGKGDFTEKLERHVVRPLRTSQFRGQQRYMEGPLTRVLLRTTGGFVENIGYDDSLMRIRFSLQLSCKIQDRYCVGRKHRTVYLKLNLS